MDASGPHKLPGVEKLRLEWFAPAGEEGEGEEGGEEQGRGKGGERKGVGLVRIDERLLDAVCSLLIQK